MFEVIVRRKGSPVEATHVYDDAYAAHAARLAIVAQLYRLGWRGQRNAAGVWRMWRGRRKNDRIAICIVELAEFSAN